MTFTWPRLLWILILTPLFAAWIERGRRRRHREWIAYGRPGPSRREGSWAWLAAFVLFVFAAAGPRIGNPWSRSGASGGDVVLVIDVSRSMAVEDATPNRLAVAKEAAKSLVRSLAASPGSRAGVAAFAGRGILRVPLTESLGGVIDAINDLKPGSIQPGGTDLGSALAAAFDAFDDQPQPDGRTIVVFSDGEDLSGAWRDELAPLRDARVIVHTVAIGDDKAPHRVPGPGGKGGGLLYEGKSVTSRRVDETLSACARETGGTFVALGLASADMGSLYRERIEPAAKTYRRLNHLDASSDRSAIFAGLGLFIGLYIGRPARLRPSWRRRARRRRPRPAPAIAALALLGIGSSPTPEPARSVAKLIQAGNAAYSSSAHRQALELFEQAIRTNPRSPIPRYNAAATLYQLRRPKEAIERYREARERLSDHPLLNLKISYGIANAQLAAGDLAAAIAAYDACLADPTKGAAADRVRSDAAANRNFAVAQAQPPHERPPNPDVESESGERTRNRQGGPAGGNEGSPGEQAPSGSGRGGAGGGGSNPNRGPQDPSARLSSAVERIRKARSRRIGDADTQTTETNLKDW